MSEKCCSIYNLSRVFFQLLTCFFIKSFSHFCFAFVIKLLAFRHADLELYPAIFPVNSRYYERHAFLRGLFFELFDLFSVKQQLSGPQRLVILLVSVRIRRNMSVQQPNLAVFDRNVRILELDAARP